MAGSWEAAWPIPNPGAPGTRRCSRVGWLQSQPQIPGETPLREDKARRKSVLEAGGEPGSHDPHGASSAPLRGERALEGSWFSLRASAACTGGERACREGQREEEGREDED